MATTKSTRNPTLSDLVDRLGPDNKYQEIAEVLNETNEMLDDMTFVEANGVTEHVTTVRSGLPTVTWRKLNYGVMPSKSKTKKVKDSLGMLEAFATVDKKLAELNGMKESWRTSENTAFIEAMSQTLQRAVLFGDSTKDPEQIMGLAPRFNTIQKSKAENAINVIDAGGTGSNLTSIWLVAWSPDTVFCTYPKGSKAGLVEQDIGEEAAYDEDGGEYRVLKTHYAWDIGLVVRDWRYVVRIANIDLDTLKKDPDAEGGADLIDLMTDAIERLPNERKGRLAFYCNRQISTFLRKQRRYAKNVNITQEEVAGRKVTAFDGVPIRRVDALTVGETQVK
jgi:hypothetical protein